MADQAGDPKLNIELIHLQGFKSAADIRLENVDPFTLLTGANGAGKSNLVDGLAFFGAVVSRGAVQAVREYGGFGNIHCFKHSKVRARMASLELKIVLNGELNHYFIKIHRMDDGPQLEEKLIVDGNTYIEREKAAVFSITFKNTLPVPISRFLQSMSALTILGDTPLHQFLTNIQVFRFDPHSAKEPDSAEADATLLDKHGRNVATILAAMENKAEFHDDILQWLGRLVPNMEHVSAEEQRLDGSTVLTFKETGFDTRFPARLVSDGTIYALCILLAVLGRSSELGLTIIEEPERGIHPKAIAQLVTLMRENAQIEHPVFITTHSELIERNASPAQRWQVSKVEGKTELKNVAMASVTKAS